jgi:hypothetical protein
MTGSVVKDITTGKNGVITLNGSELANGMYIVHISSGDKAVSRKINIQH